MPIPWNESSCPRFASVVTPFITTAYILDVMETVALSCTSISTEQMVYIAPYLIRPKRFPFLLRSFSRARFSHLYLASLSRTQHFSAHSVQWFPFTILLNLLIFPLRAGAFGFCKSDNLDSVSFYVCNASVVSISTSVFFQVFHIDVNWPSLSFAMSLSRIIAIKTNMKLIIYIHILPMGMSWITTCIHGVFRGNFCQLATLSKKLWTDFHEIFKIARTDMAQGIAKDVN